MKGDDEPVGSAAMGLARAPSLFPSGVRGDRIRRRRRRRPPEPGEVVAAGAPCLASGGSG